MGPERTSATPESHAAMLFLLISPSARVNGMGEAGVALADEPGGYYNPATPALMAGRYFFGTVNYLGEMKWLPRLAKDIRYSYNAFQLGWSLESLSSISVKPGVYIPFSLSGAVAYYRSRLDLGEQVRTDEFGRISDTFHSFDKADNLVFSAGLHFILDFGVGVTLKRLTSVLGPGSATGTAYDIGFQTRIPVVKAVEYFGKELNLGQLQPKLNLIGGISWNNRGDDIVYRIDSKSGYADPLPANRRAGLAVEVGLSWNEGKVAFDLFKATGAIERYTPQIGGIKKRGTSDNKRGYEFSFFETLEVRRGRYDDNDGGRHLNTEGFTVKSDGVSKLIALLISRGSRDRPGAGIARWFGFVVRHLSLSWTKFEYLTRGHF